MPTEDNANGWMEIIEEARQYLQPFILSGSISLDENLVFDEMMAKAFYAYMHDRGLTTYEITPDGDHRDPRYAEYESIQQESFVLRRHLRITDSIDPRTTDTIFHELETDVIAMEEAHRCTREEEERFRHKICILTHVDIRETRANGTEFDRYHTEIISLKDRMLAVRHATDQTMLT